MERMKRNTTGTGSDVLIFCTVHDRYLGDRPRADGIGACQHSTVCTAEDWTAGYVQHPTKAGRSAANVQLGRSARWQGDGSPIDTEANLGLGDYSKAISRGADTGAARAALRTVNQEIARDIALGLFYDDVVATA